MGNPRQHGGVRNGGITSADTRTFQATETPTHRIIRRQSSHHLGLAQKKNEKDALASVLIRVLHIMEAYIPCRIFVEHLPRKSNTIATICDNLSRKSTTTSTDLSHITHNEDDLPFPFLQWLAHPAENWQLGTEIVNYLMSN